MLLNIRRVTTMAGACIATAVVLAGAPQSPAADRVAGAPGDMRIIRSGCEASATITPDLRRRIVDIVTHEWAFFGYGVIDQTIGEVDEDEVPAEFRVRGRGRPRIPPAEAARVAPAIAGYWAVTPEGGWILDRQNEAWTGPAGVGARWNSPWSAAFISWVMCEAGVGDPNTFIRAVAHHRYIDQAIRARDNQARQSAFVAYDAGEAAIVPGDLLCSGRRPAYLSLAERRRQMGQGASTHCDFVVSVDVTQRRFLAIGGNVRSSVSLKIIPGEWDARTERLRPLRFDRATLGDNPYRGARPVFAHLKMRADTIPSRALACAHAATLPPAARLLCG